MALAIFDLDNTLLAGDSDYLWGQFLAELGVVDAVEFTQENERFYRDYRKGCLDIQAFLRFSLRPLGEHTLGRLLEWRQTFIETMIVPIILPAARTLLETHRQRGDTLIIITATNVFVAAPIAERLGVTHLLATELERNSKGYTGCAIGMPCFQAGKITHLMAWLEAQGESLRGSYFYSDSHNDIPLLECVEHPVAVDPDATLRAVAQRRGWRIISLRSG